MNHRELLIAGHLIGGPCDQSVGKEVVRSPFDDHVVGTVAEGNGLDLRNAIDAASEAFKTWRYSPRRERQSLLRRIAQLARERKDELVGCMVDEIGKPVTAACGEIDRMALTFDLAADLLTEYGTEQVPTSMDPRGSSFRCSVERFPIGVVLAITPYNWPYNLAAHKIAPALATGNTIVLKPSPLAAYSTLTLAHLIHEAGCPAGVLNAWNGPTRDVEQHIADPRIAMISFTGSENVGWKLKTENPTKRVTLELGGNSTAIVCEDADQQWAADRIVNGAFGYAGQVCISVQHVLVSQKIYAEFREQLIAKTKACPFGNPQRSDVVCGPLISDAAVDRVLGMVHEAAHDRALILTGGRRDKRMLEPILMEYVPSNCRLATEEAFGPVLTVSPYETLEGAIAKVNSSRFGIHCGVFTRDIRTAEQAYRELDVAGVVIDDAPNMRFDNLPYGGVRRSGFGREGVRYAMDEMTDPKALMIRTD